MKKFLIATVVAVFAAVAFTALSVAAPWSGSARAKADAANRLPALPAEVRQRRRWKIGVKCDFPPFGYINRQNRIAGYDVDVARRFAELAFGRRNRVSLTCVTTPSRNVSSNMNASARPLRRFSRATTGESESTFDAPAKQLPMYRS